MIGDDVVTHGVPAGEIVAARSRFKVGVHPELLVIDGDTAELFWSMAQRSRSMANFS